MMASRDKRPTRTGSDGNDEGFQTPARSQVVPLHSHSPERVGGFAADGATVEQSLASALPDERSRSGQQDAAYLLLPRLRRDLIVSGQDVGTVRVRAPESPTEFPIYKVEWKIAQAMDGTRTLADIARVAGREGLVADEKLVRSLVQELKGYRFLVTTNVEAPQQRFRMEDVVKLALSDEERTLAESALAVLADTGEDSLAGHLSAILAINPTNEAAKAMQTELATRVVEQPRPTDRSPAPIVVHHANRRLLYGVAGIALVAIIVAAVLVYQANRALNVALSHVAAVPAEVPTPNQPAANDVTPEQSPVTVNVEVQARVVDTLRAGVAGKVSDVLVKPGDTVTNKTVLAVLTDESAYERYVAARSQLAELEARARKDQVVRYFLAGQRAKLRKVISRIKVDKITSPREGTVGKIYQNVGDSVEADSSLVDFTNPSELVGTLPAGTVPFSIEGARCSLVRNGGSCRVIEGPVDQPNLMQIVIDNGREELRPGETLEIRIAPPGARSKQGTE